MVEGGTRGRSPSGAPDMIGVPASWGRQQRVPTLYASPVTARAVWPRTAGPELPACTRRWLNASPGLSAGGSGHSGCPASRRDAIAGSAHARRVGGDRERLGAEPFIVVPAVPPARGDGRTVTGPTTPVTADVIGVPRVAGRQPPWRTRASASSVTGRWLAEHSSCQHGMPACGDGQA